MKVRLCLIKSPMNVTAVTTDPVEVKKILRHLVKVGWQVPPNIFLRVVPNPGAVL